MRRTVLIVLPLLAGCAAAGQEDAATQPVAKDSCRNEGLERFIGRTAGAGLGAELLRASGARILRWGTPGMAMTMDFRADRLTVSYDGKMTITSARCG